MDKLNPQQQEAINTVDGPLLILAGAGSGKTKVLTHRIAHLLEIKACSYENILAVTFTNKAANEMKKRVSLLLGDKRFNNYTSPLFWLGTFHAICLKMLKAHHMEAGLDSNFLIYDTDEQLDIVKSTLKQLGLADQKISPKGILSNISNAKNELLKPSDYDKYAQGFLQEIVGKVYHIYQKKLNENNALDFDDLIMKTVKLFEEYPNILEKFQNQFKYILIDEYQDTNHAQYKFANLLADKHHNICVVGDDAQSIYSFRGANIKNILNFERDYPEAKIIKLEQNYRSTKKILAASNEIISLNKNQKQKKLWTENSDGAKLVVYEALNEKDEATWIGKKIQDLSDKGISMNEVVVLYRTNAQSRSLEEGFLRLGINYQVIGGVRFYSRKEIKDILAYLKIIYNQKDNVSLLRVINTPRRNIGPKKIADALNLANQNGLPLLLFLLKQDETSKIDKAFIGFAKILNELIIQSSELSLSKFIEKIIKITGYYDMLNDGTTENESRIENIKELISVASKYDVLDSKNALETFLNEVALIEEQSNRNETATDKVTLMTIHAAKGLEFDYVFIAGLEEGIFPHSRAFLDPTELEEERRLAYVALTRAKLQLYLSYAESRLYYGGNTNNPVSRFVTDISEDLISIETTGDMTRGWQNADDFFKTETPIASANKVNLAGIGKGDIVKHAVFGIGQIIDMDDTTIIISFSGGRKELSLEYAQLEKI
jgi:DNA helicase-2/ATP-dependent DNA helicase PcrA